MLGDLAEEQLKNVIVFLDGKDVVLAEVEVTAAESTSPLVLFCAGHQQPEQRIRGFMKTRKGNRRYNEGRHVQCFDRLMPQLNDFY